MIVIGLTGGIASGKSTVSTMLEDLGAAIIDADQIGHEICDPYGETWEKLVSTFGRGILKENEEIDRAKLGAIVFHGRDALKRLNRIMHPRMRRIVAKRLAKLEREGIEVAVIEATLLIEARWTDLVDQVWVTVSNEESVIKRLQAHRNLSEEQARARLRSQRPIAERAAGADVVIHNDADIEELSREVHGAWESAIVPLLKKEAPGTATASATWKEKTKSVLLNRARVAVTRDGFNPSAVLIPVYENGGEVYVVLTKRTDSVLHHKGQVSFPGGAHDDSDADLKATALREAYEEIGLEPGHVEILGLLDDQATLTSHFIITPFVGAIPYPYKFKINHLEVEVLIEAPVSALLGPECYSHETVDEEGKLHSWASFLYTGHHITGITARILEQFLELAAEIKPG